MTKVLVTGGSGLIGTLLCQRLAEKGYEVAILSRSFSKDSSIPSYKWSVSDNYIDPKAIDTADVIIHLAGASLMDRRWTPQRKRAIIDSRVNSGQLIYNKLKAQNKSLHAFISASGIGYYGAKTSVKIFSENDAPASDFVGNVCVKWEDMADRFKTLGIRTVKIRTGIVLARKGGALSQIATPVKQGIGSALGTGKQFQPWIHIEDLCDIYIKSIEDNSFNGAYNAISPHHVSNIEFTKSIAGFYNRPLWLPKVPPILLKIIYGKRSALILEGSRVSCKKIQSTGFQFKFPILQNALSDLLSHQPATKFFK